MQQHVLTVAFSLVWYTKDFLLQILNFFLVKVKSRVLGEKQQCIILLLFPLKGPFATFKMQYDRTCEWTGLKFSNDGKLILISTNGGFIRLIDAFKGAVLHTFGGYNNSKAVTLEASFTPDSQFIMIGSEDGKIHVWNGESGMKVAVLDGKHTGPITCLQFNPKFMTFASACSNMAFWLPTIDD